MKVQFPALQDLFPAASHLGWRAGRDVIGPGTGKVREVEKDQFSGSNLIESDAIRHQLGSRLPKM